MEVLTFIEIDVDLDPVETFRFTFPQEENLYDAIPALMSVNVTPSVVDPGTSIGQRASVNIVFKDFLHTLGGTPFESGTFFGKLRARKKSLQGSALRVIRGELGQSLSEMVTEHYSVESMTRSSGDRVTLIAKDLLKLADGDRAQAPAVSNGRLAASIDEDDASLMLSPVGIGDLEYPSSGKVAIGGSEIVSFTRSGDSMSITRAQSGTDAEEHDADEVVQLVLEYSSESPADIIYDLLSTYTGIDPDWLPLDEWKADIDSYIGRLYSAEIAEPTAVSKLLNELIEQIGLVMWWDAVNQKVRLRSLRPVAGAREVHADEMMADTFGYTEQPGKRVSQVWTHFALRNPLAKLDDSQNYRSVLVTIDSDAESEYGQPAIRKVFSRWIAINNRPAASRLNGQLISRFRDPPRKFKFDLFRTSVPPMLGQGMHVGHWSLQDENGDLVTAPAQVTSIEAEEDRYAVSLEEMLFADFVDPNDPDTGGAARIVIIDNNTLNVNLRSLHDSFYVEATSGDEVLCIVEEGITVGSASTGMPAFDVGDWASGVVITVRVRGRILGAGGKGGGGGNEFVTARSGSPGGTALYTRYAIYLENFGIIGGGGGGGGGFVFPGITELGQGGGGGAGCIVGSAGGPGAIQGSATTGGAGGFGAGAGGNLGDAGFSSTEAGAGTTDGGAGGAAIDGASFVTYTEAGDIRGAQVN